MNKKLLLIALVLLGLEKAICQDTIYAYAWTPSSAQFFDLNDRDTFNRYFYIDSSNSNNIWQLGVPSKLLFDSAYSFPLALTTDSLNSYPINNTSSFNFILWTDCNWTKIYFTHKINTDSSADGGVIEYSTDGGNTWINIINTINTLWNFYSPFDSIESNSDKAGFSGTHDWIVSAFEGPTISNYVWYRFTFTSDSINTNKEGWMIDDIIVNGIMVGINEIDTNSIIKVFPNPTSDFIAIQIDSQIQFISASIKDILGKPILVTRQRKVDLTEIETGIYFIEVLTTSGKYVTRVIKK